MAVKKEKIKWSLVEINKADIKTNPNNPKIRNAKGFRRLDKLREKYGTIFDGIVNADNALIDGHSRLEQNPNGKGHYFKPDRLLSQKDYKELNTLFDMAKAGDIDNLIVEEIFTEDQMNEWEVDRKVKAVDNQKNVKYPIVPEYDEQHDALIIVCSTNKEISFIRNALGMNKARSYKNATVGESSVITGNQFIKAWEKKSK